MSNGFEALAPLADKLKTQALRQEAEREAKQKASEHIARETNVFLDVMNQTVVQLGGTWAPTDHTRLLAGINLSFPRYHNVAPEGDVMFRPSPVHMYVGAGIAF